MSSYRDGVRVEHAVMHALTREGYDCTRAASSKGVADVIAFKPGQCVLVSCKRTNPLLPPAERAELVRVAGYLPGGVAVVATRPLRAPLAYRRLTGAGPRDWVPWTPDEVAS